MPVPDLAPVYGSADQDKPYRLIYTPLRVTVGGRETPWTLPTGCGELGLERYAEAFRDNAIEPEVLSELSEADLEKIGVLLGHRKIMLKAIAELRPQAPQPLPEPAPAVPASPLPHPPPHAGDGRAPAEAERRQLTIMFCDLVGSTPLATRLDPEDLRDVIGAYHRAVAEVIARFDGFVAKYMGDGVLAYFGYPRAHEDDAERAVRAGLALVEAVPQLQLAAAVGLQIRIGIATGLVVVGDLTGSGEAQERGVVGETQPRCPPANFGAARHGGDRAEHAAADRRPLRLPRAWRR